MKRPAGGGLVANEEALLELLAAAVDFLDLVADLLIDARLVAAAHTQWADTEAVERG